MFNRWTSHLTDPEEKINFQHRIHSSKDVLDRLLQIMKEDEANLGKVEESVKSFSEPNWEYRQAYYLGARANIHANQKLVDLDQQKPPQEKTNDRQFTRTEPQ